MAQEDYSLAILEALPGKTEELTSTLRELYTLMRAKGYCRDVLYCDAAHSGRFVHLRYWTAANMRSEAQSDPEVHRYWQMLPDLCNIVVIHETLEKVFES